MTASPGATLDRRGRALRIGIVGAGLAGAACARALADAGCEVQVFDKSRGVGGRMATRRVAWAPEAASPITLHFDHGAPGWTAQAPAFLAFLAQAEAVCLVRRWAPRVVSAPGGPLVPGPEGWVVAPDMPALSRALLRDIAVQAGRAVTALQARPDGWQLLADGELLAHGLDAVGVAIPPVQGAALWAPHRPPWAAQAQAHPMSPCWTLMALTGEPQPAHAQAGEWDEMWPAESPLARVIRQDARPGRPRMPGRAQWVAHADPIWAHAHLEAPPEEVLPALQRALEHVLGTALTWHHAAVHRWRYAQAQARVAPGPVFAWDPQSGLGACGDYLGGGGIEAAFLSGRHLARAMLGQNASLPAG